MYCPKCGCENENVAKYCVQCGGNFETWEKGTVNTPKQKNVILMRLLLAICIVFLVFVGMFSALLFIMGIVESIPSMAVCGFIFLAGSVVGTVFSAKGLSKYSVKKPNKQISYVQNIPSYSRENNYQKTNIVPKHKNNNANAKYTLKGFNGQLYVYENKIVIERKGLVAVSFQGLKGTKTIPISEIKSIQVKPAGAFRGYIQFGISGGIEGRHGVGEAKYDENTVVFEWNQNKNANNIKSYLESIMLNKTNSTNTIIQQTSSNADELLKFKKLLDDGVITQEEFETKKKQLLGL